MRPRLSPAYGEHMQQQVAEFEQRFVQAPEGSQPIGDTDPTQVLGQLPDDEARIWVLASLAGRGVVDMRELTAPDFSGQFTTLDASVIAAQVARYTQAPRVEKFAMRFALPSIRRAIKLGAIER